MAATLRAISDGESVDLCLHLINHAAVFILPDAPSSISTAVAWLSGRAIQWDAGTPPPPSERAKAQVIDLGLHSMNHAAVFIRGTVDQIQSQIDDLWLGLSRRQQRRGSGVSLSCATWKMCNSFLATSN